MKRQIPNLPVSAPHCCAYHGRGEGKSAVKIQFVQATPRGVLFYGLGRECLDADREDGREDDALRPTIESGVRALAPLTIAARATRGRR